MNKFESLVAQLPEELKEQFFKNVEFLKNKQGIKSPMHYVKIMKKAKIDLEIEKQRLNEYANTEEYDDALEYFNEVKTDILLTYKKAAKDGIISLIPEDYQKYLNYFQKSLANQNYFDILIL